MGIVMKACSPGGIDVEEGIVTKIHAAGFRPAISSEVIPAGSVWKIRMKTLNGWILVGITGASTPTAKSYADSTSYGWANNNLVYVGGKDKKPKMDMAGSGGSQTTWLFSSS